MKDKADFVVVEDRPVPTGKNVRSDQIISLFQHAREGKNLFFRRIVFWDEQNQQELVFLTNHLKFAASTMAAIHKDRWQIELFFKSLKQLCKIKNLRWDQPQCRQDPGLDGI